MTSRLRAPSAGVHRSSLPSSAMEVESTRVQTLADGKKLIDVTMRRAVDNDKLELPQFDDDDSSSSSSDDEGNDPPPASPQKAHGYRYRQANDEDDEEEHTSGHPQHPQQSMEDFQWHGVDDIQSLTNANAAFHAQVHDLKAHVKSLQIQLEVLAPVPGLNVAAVQDLLLDKAGAEHDIRDAKIVHQAKTLRQLKRALQRDKQLVTDAVKQCKAMEAAKAALEKENETLTLKLARFQARASAGSTTIGTEESTVPDTTKDKDTSSSSSATLRRKYDDLRIKHDKLVADLKKAQRVLVREVGENVNIEELIEATGNNDSAKRGRAQQIVMLKAKVKKLEAELQAKRGGSSTGLERHDVDTRAQQEIVAQQAQRQRLNDKLTAERDDLFERVQQLTTRLEGAKSRAQTLEKERQDHKAKLQLLVGKSRNDDALVDALQKQLEIWKSKMEESKRARTAETVLPKDDRLELERLRAQVNEYKRQSTSTPMVAITEAAQFRAQAAEKERLKELVKSLQAQVEDKERQLRSLNQSEGGVAPSRIPRPGVNGKAMPPIGTEQYVPVPPPSESGAVDAIRRTLAAKEQEINALKNQVEHSTDAQQEIQDLQEENDYLRQEFDRLKMRYEAVLKNSHSSSSLKASSTGSG